jgi:hypothetical protein
MAYKIALLVEVANSWPEQMVYSKMFAEIKAVK